MNRILWFAGIAFSLLFLHHYKTVAPSVNLPAGAVVKESDIWSHRGDFWGEYGLDLATDPHQIVGHKVLKPLYAGRDIHLSDLSK